MQPNEKDRMITSFLMWLCLIWGALIFVVYEAHCFPLIGHHRKVEWPEPPQLEGYVNLNCLASKNLNPPNYWHLWLMVDYKNSVRWSFHYGVFESDHEAEKVCHEWMKYTEKLQGGKA